MYKVGDLVRVIKTGDIYNVMGIGSNTGRKLYLYISGLGKYEEEIEPVTHLTTKEFIRLVEDLEYEVTFKDDYYIRVFQGDQELITIDKLKVNHLDTDICSGHCESKISNELFKIATLYASTPLELREEKEKLYTLQCPLTKEYLIEWDDNEYKWSSKMSREFTQEEIENLENQDLIKTLIKKEVKDNE